MWLVYKSTQDNVYIPHEKERGRGSYEWSFHKGPDDNLLNICKGLRLKLIFP